MSKNLKRQKQIPRDIDAIKITFLQLFLKITLGTSTSFYLNVLLTKHMLYNQSRTQTLATHKTKEN